MINMVNSHLNLNIFSLVADISENYFLKYVGSSHKVSP